MIKEMIVDIDGEKQNIKSYLEQSCQLSARRVKALLKNKKVWLNGKTAYWDNVLHQGDLLKLDLAELGKDSILPEDLPLNILYEDLYFLALNKPAGMLVHPTQNHPSGTLSNAVKHYFLQQGQEIPVRLINRIDRDTSGIVLVAKTGDAHAALAEQFDLEECEKLYFAIAEGCIGSKTGKINEPIGIDHENPTRRAVRRDGQPSVTYYEVLEQYEEAAFLKLRLETGRTHQIRVHMSSLGHPLLGDQLYGGSLRRINRQALHACEMSFRHPFSKALIRITAALPMDMEEVIKDLKGSMQHNTGAGE